MAAPRRPFQDTVKLYDGKGNEVKYVEPQRPATPMPEFESSTESHRWMVYAFAALIFIGMLVLIAAGSMPAA